MNDKGAILHAEKQEKLLQIDNMILMGMVEHFQSSQNSNFAMYLKYVKKEVRDEDDFLHADISIRMTTSWFQYFEHQRFLEGDTIINDEHDEAFWKYSKKQVHKSLQNFEQTLSMEFIFCMQINIKVSESWHYRCWWKRPDMSKVSKIGS